MKILAIETSCDDTGIAILDVSKNGAFDVLANIVSSQTALGKKYGGVFPAMAKREHQKNLVPTLISALKKSGLVKKPDKSPEGHFDGPAIISPRASLGGILEREPELKKNLVSFLKKYGKPDVDLISVTNGPGLEPCLWVGVNFAKAISSFWNIPVVAVNHIESHILVNLLESPGMKFPAIALVVSGGHTQIILVKKPFGAAQGKSGNYEILGETRDDAAGECFDKCAKILGLGYPGGPVISKLAAKARLSCESRAFAKLPRPMIGTKDYDFSFSGLKTAVLYADRKIKNKTKKYKQEMAADIQQAIIDVLIKKTMKAVKDFKAKSLILGGGVSANKELRNQMQKKLAKELPNAKFLVPSPHLSTDNALMTAITGFYHLPTGRQAKKMAWKKIQADGNLRIE